jgi:hypothetical protein
MKTKKFILLGKGRKYNFKATLPNGEMFEYSIKDFIFKHSYPQEYYSIVKREVFETIMNDLNKGIILDTNIGIMPLKIELTSIEPLEFKKEIEVKYWFFCKTPRVDETLKIIELKDSNGNDEQH